MNSAKVLPIITFVFGAGIGCGVTWYFTKKYYELKEEEEIESIKERYNFESIKKEYSPIQDVLEEPEEVHVQDIKELARITRDTNKKVDYNSISSRKGEAEVLVVDEHPLSLEHQDAEKEVERPYVIDPIEYGECGYNMISLVRYSDGVLTDINDNIIDDVDEIVGSDYAEYIGKFEDDAVHIRNDAKRCDYEILIDLRSWQDVLESKPYLKTED